MFLKYPSVFVRKKREISSGVISIQVIDKSTGHYKVKKTINSSTNQNEIVDLVIEGIEWIESYNGILKLDLDSMKKQVTQTLDNISKINTCGVEILLGKIFFEIGFNKIQSPLFKLLVLTRIENPVSKLKTTDYWFKYHNISIDIVNIYRYLDKLYETEQETIQQISFEHTQKILRGNI